MKKKIQFTLPLRLTVTIAVVLLIAFGAVFLYNHNPTGANLVGSCLTNSLFGIYCPGCGLTRCLYSILHLDFYQAFRYNSAVFILLPVFAVYLAIRLIDWVVTGKNRIDRHIPTALFIVIFILVLIYGIVRNIPVYPFTLLIPTVV